MQPKRTPLLMDEFLMARADSLSKHYGKRFRKLLPVLHDQAMVAKRFVLDAQATRYLGETVRDVPEAIAYAQEFAIPAFPKMWVEFPAKVLYEAVTGQPADDLSDERLAYFYLGPNVYVIIDGHGDRAGAKSNIALSPFYYRLNQPFDVEQQGEFAKQFGVSRLGIDAFMWGMASSKFWGGPHKVVEVTDAFGHHTLAAEFDANNEPNPAFSMLRANNSVDHVMDNTFLDQIPIERRAAWLQTHNGDLRNIIAMLLFLNRTSKTQYRTDYGPVRQMLHAKARTFVGYTSISVHLNPVPALRTMLHDAGEQWRRRHDVRGHFCLNKQARHAEALQCVGGLHEWAEVGVNQWRCARCTGLKWWRKAHQRGHIETGLIQADYAVTK
jgi:hypothetical protein